MTFIETFQLNALAPFNFDLSAQSSPAETVKSAFMKMACAKLYESTATLFWSN